MKNAAEYARKVKRLLGTLKRSGGKPTLESSEEPLEQLMRGILGRTAAESRVQTALGRLRAAMVDVNELRVTPVSELVEVIGADYPHARSVAESLSRALHAIYNRRHKLDLAFLKAGGRRGAETFLTNLDGVDPYARAVFLLGQFDAPVVPVDDAMLSFLRREGYVPEAAERAEVQAFLERYVPAKETAAFYVLLKRHAAAHAPRSTGRASEKRKGGNGDSGGAAVLTGIGVASGGDGQVPAAIAGAAKRNKTAPAPRVTATKPSGGQRRKKQAHKK